MEQMKKHHFFYGVDWDTIRRIDAPFVPSLRSITDTSYFPTDELDQVPETPVVDANAASKDLAFLGSVRFSTADISTALTGHVIQIYIQAVLDHSSSLLI